MSRKAAIITAFDPFVFRGGIETYTLQLLTLLKSKGIDVTLYHIGCLRNERATDSSELNDPFFKNIYRLGRNLFREDKKYDFIIANSFYGMGYFPPSIRTFTIYHSVYAGYIEKYRNRYPEDPCFNFKFLREEIGEYISGYNKTKIAVSDEVKRELDTIYGFKDVEVVCHGIDTMMFKKEEHGEQLRDRMGIPKNAFVGIFVGRWENVQKRNDIMSHIISERNDIYWLLVLGTGGDECELKDKPNVLIKKDIPHEDMHLFYSVSDFMLFPSAYEGFGLGIIEAMACGLPVITTNVGVAKSIYKEQPFRRLLLHDMSQCDAKDLAVIDEKINVLKEDQKFRSEIVREGIVLIQERFSLKRWKKDMETALNL
jgi:glycosyltransferase involved in cell wall biosynthesis